MHISKEGLIELANYEALSHTKYIDSGGVHTIGIGMTVSEIKDLMRWPWDRALSTKECIDMYRQALVKYEDALNKALKVNVAQHQFDALVSITYNIGTGGMAGSTFIKRINDGRTISEVVEAMKRWNKDNGKVVRGLVNRRNAEALLYATGQYKNDGTVQLIKVGTNHKPIYSGREDISKYF